MKKSYIISIRLTIIFILLAGVVWLKVKENIDEYNKDPSYKYTSERRTGVADEKRNQLGIDHDSTEDEVMNVVHRMTHQKVVADEKWGAIEMTSKNIKTVYDIVTNSDFPNKNNMLEILTDWKAGDFSHIVADHNWFWNYEEGQVGEAIRPFTHEEEKAFIEAYFSTSQITSEIISDYR